ncbi:ABC transporter ATP-binding protein [Cohnella sp. REN36]|uniref:ABC transporter ATP-binding protein n=1 Tax=Cohnella sp. REN36 TaxID=2887347 RepID=UPI001D14860E|nr:ABC transporter ATP-binding protein [Cohnella sp. REN36]MCC3375322.1 ABC transporter ATP-binding protein [Cohnella sp. REN36]
MASIEFVRVTKSFEKSSVIDNLNLTIEDGKFTVLVGPSGCGKTTLLRMIAGIGPQSSGEVRIGGKDVSRVPPGKRGVAMVFQNYAIYPTMTVRDNIEFGLKNNRVPKAERTRLVETIGATVGLAGYLDRMPSTLSGGQRQRVALARAMVKEPSVFLMDEPLSNLDAKLRAQMRIELIELHKKLGATFVYVTHDQVEAMSMADTIVLMNEGVIQQEAPPEDVYRDPANLFAAQFIGVPPMNVGELGIDGVRFGFRPESADLAVLSGAERELAAAAAGDPIRPGAGAPKPAGADEARYAFRGRIATREMLGAETLYQVRRDGEPGASFMVKCFADRFAVDQEVELEVPADKLFFFDAAGDRIRRDHPAHDAYVAALCSREPAHA